MTPSNPNASSTAVAKAIQSAADAEALIGHFGDVMASLLHILEEETQLVRAGRISEVARIEPEKADLARRYLADAALVKGNGSYLARELPQEFDALRQQHDDFRALLDINLAVLATAHAVSEGIIRGVAGELARKAAPHTYAATGRPTVSTARAAQPISLSRTI